MKNLLFVRREETKNKWWHRLMLVCVYGGAILMTSVVIGIVFEEIIDAKSYKIYSYTYNFEQGYEFIEGEEITCGFLMRRCGDIEEVVKKYNDSVRSVLLTDEIRDKCANVSSVEPISRGYVPLSKRYIPVGERNYVAAECKIILSDTEVIKPGLDLSAFGLSESIYSSEQKNFLRDSYNKFENLEAKQNLEEVLYSKIIGDVSLGLLVVIFSLIAWIIFWESLVYRTILYIIYGKAEIKK